MESKGFRRLTCLAIALMSFGLCPAHNIARADTPKNIIVMIADGWGHSHVKATTYYQHGESGRQVYERDFTLYGMSTFPADSPGYDPDLAWSDFSYIEKGATDSAAAATAMSTGVKTRKGVIGLDPSGNTLKHAIEHAEELGKATGVVTSVPLSHATPAGFVAHKTSRASYEEIAQEMLLTSAVDVIMGTGHPLFDDNGRAVPPEAWTNPEERAKAFRYVGGESTWKALGSGTAGADADGDGIPDAWTLIQKRAEFQAIAQGETPKRVIGVAEVRSTLQADRDGIDDNPEDDLPGQTPLIDTVPTLAEMSLAALNVLRRDPDGFFLMIEGGAVDWACHGNATGRMIEEMMDFNRAVESVVRWIEQHGGWEETLLIVTGDHETGYLVGPGSDPEWKPIQNNGIGVLPGVEWKSKGHTNSLVPFFVRGAGAENFEAEVSGIDPRHGRYLDNTAIGRVAMSLMRETEQVTIEVP